MENKKSKDLLIKTKTLEGEEGWITMTEFGCIFFDTISEMVDSIAIEMKKEHQRTVEKINNVHNDTSTSKVDDLKLKQTAHIDSKCEDCNVPLDIDDKNICKCCVDDNKLNKKNYTNQWT